MRIALDIAWAVNVCVYRTHFNAPQIRRQDLGLWGDLRGMHSKVYTHVIYVCAPCFDFEDHEQYG